MLAKFNLHSDFDKTTENNEPHQHEPRLGANNGCGNQLTGSNDGSRKDKARSEISQASPNSWWEVPVSQPHCDCRGHEANDCRMTLRWCRLALDRFFRQSGCRGFVLRRSLGTGLHYFSRRGMVYGRRMNRSRNFTSSQQWLAVQHWRQSCMGTRAPIL